MKKIKLTRGKLAIVDDEDFDFLNQWKWCFISSGYAGRAERINKKRGKFILMHRLINKTPIGFETDHLNRNKLDNRRSNLKTVTMSQNKMNTGVQSNNTSGHKGVHWFKRDRKWQVYIKKDGKRIHLGYFSNIKSAILMRKNAEKRYAS